MLARIHHSPRLSGEVRLGDPVLDRYLEFVESRARHNTLLAIGRAAWAILDNDEYTRTCIRAQTEA